MLRSIAERCVELRLSCRPESPCLIDIASTSGRSALTAGH